jgi:hypothetical protein
MRTKSDQNERDEAYVELEGLTLYAAGQRTSIGAMSRGAKIC